MGDNLHALFCDFGPGGLAPVAWSVVLVGLAAGALSPLVVMGRLAFFSDAVAHAMLLGVAVSLVADAGGELWCMLAVGIAVGLAVSWLRRRTGQTLDTLLGVSVAAALAAGFLVYHHYRGYRDLHAYLLGDIALIPSSWFGWCALAAIGVVIAALVMFNRQALLAVSREFAQTRGVRPAREDALLMVVLAVVIVLGVRTMGLLMINAMLVLPAACSRNLCRTLGAFFWVAVVAAGLASAGGLAASYAADAPPGPSIVAAASVLFILSLLVRRK